MNNMDELLLMAILAGTTFFTMFLMVIIIGLWKAYQHTNMTFSERMRKFFENY